MYSRLLAYGLSAYCILWLGAAFAASAHAEVVIQTMPSPYEVRTAGYEAKVDRDGCLTNLRVQGQEFLAPGVAISRGSYFYLGGPLQLQSVDRPTDATIEASGGAAGIRYEFADDHMTWHPRNRTTEPLVFFLVFAGEIEALQVDGGGIVSGPVTSDATKLTCYRGNAALSIDGVSRVWGPWQGPHQVAQVDLGPSEEKTLLLRVHEATPEVRKQILALVATAPEPTLTVLSPRPYQVFQRSSEDEGTVLVSGRCAEEAEAVEVLIKGSGLTGPLPEQWQTIPVVSSIHEFNKSFEIPAGGWYSLHVRAMKEGGVLAEASVDHFGIGEVFVGAGQSNSTNCGEFKTQQTSGMVSSFSGQHWQLADDPQPGAADRTQGGSFWPAFGDALYAQYGVPIGVAVTGYGGTSVNQWQPSDELFDWMMTRVHQLGPRGFRALLWHQGESDASMPEDEYFTKLRNLIVASREKAGWEFPWFVAQASYHNAENPQYENVRLAQKRLWDEGVALVGPDTDTLVGDHRDLDGKGIHFSPKGLTVHGQMWADQVGSYLDEFLEQDDR